MQYISVMLRHARWLPNYKLICHVKEPNHSWSDHMLYSPAPPRAVSVRKLLELTTSRSNTRQLYSSATVEEPQQITTPIHSGVHIVQL